MSAGRSIVVVFPNLRAPIDGIRDHSVWLTREFERWGCDVELVPAVPTRRGTGGNGALAMQLLILQYQPFSYGRWGVAPHLPLALAKWRLKGRRQSLIAAIVHEPYVPLSGWRWTLMGLWQRVQLQAIRLSADV